MDQRQPKPSMRPIPIVFNSKQEEENFEKWVFSGKKRPVDIKNMEGVKEARRMRERMKNDNGTSNKGGKDG